MYSFYIYETDDIPIQLSDPCALHGQRKVVVTLRQGLRKVIKKDPPTNDETGLVTLKLTQKDTGRFRPGFARLQLNVYYEDERRDVTQRAIVQVLDNDYKRGMP